MTKRSEAQIHAWLPQIGEWYALTKDSAFYTFENHEAAKTYYEREDKNPATTFNILKDGEWVFITKISCYEEHQPVLIDFMIKAEMERHEPKVHCFPLFPPHDLTMPRIWETLLERKS